MTSIAFYHLTSSRLEQALPKLLEKAYGSGSRALVVAESEEQVELLNQQLWTHGHMSFLPHGAKADGNAERQPIYLSTTLAAPNAATLLFVTDGRQVDSPPFERVFDLFDGQNDTAVTAARQRWSAYKAAGHALAYWRQTPQGGWEKAGG